MSKWLPDPADCLRQTTHGQVQPVPQEGLFIVPRAWRRGEIYLGVECPQKDFSPKKTKQPLLWEGSCPPLCNCPSLDRTHRNKSPPFKRNPLSSKTTSLLETPRSIFNRPLLPARCPCRQTLPERPGPLPLVTAGPLQIKGNGNMFKLILKGFCDL